MKRFVCLMLLLLLPCAACAEYVMAGLDAGDAYRDWNTNLFFQRMEEKTGVDFSYRQYTDEAEWTRAKASMQAGDATLPDVLFKASLTPAEQLSLLDRGVILDLAPYLESCCPHFSALLAQRPDYRQAITLPDGRIAALPNISEQPLQNCVWLNQEWLDTLRLQMPTTAEELTAVLRAFRDGDPNRNGRQDEIPLAFLGPFDLKFLGHAFGLIANDYNLREVDGQAVFVPLSEQYGAFVAWLRQLFAEGLLDPDGFTTTDMLRQVTDESAVDVYGGAITTMISNFLPATWTQRYAVMPPLRYDGRQVYRSFLGAVNGGTFAVTSACENVEEVLRWVDGFYTEEVYILASAGEENVDYVVDGDGAWRMTQSATNNLYFNSETLIASGAPAPGLASDAFQRRYADGAVAYVSEQLALINALAERPFPYVSLSFEQEEKIAPLQAKIGRLVDEQLAKWVLGETPLDEASLQGFAAALNEAGLEEFMAFWQAVLDGRSEG